MYFLSPFEEEKIQDHATCTAPLCYATGITHHKRFITLEHLAHVPMMEESELFLFTLIQEVLPLTEGRAAFAPMR